ncbi:MAG: hypothetical protein KGJ86_03010 [Chloroflexota bacterium]|nr:hypothetical protein [Chloroflexota bacterium]
MKATLTSPDRADTEPADDMRWAGNVRELEHQERQPRRIAVASSFGRALDGVDDTLERCSLVLRQPAYFLAAMGGTVLSGWLFAATGKAVRYSPLYQRWVLSASFLDMLLLFSVPLLIGGILALQIHNLRSVRGARTDSRRGLVSSVVGLVMSKWCCLLPLGISVAGASGTLVQLSGWAAMLRPVSLGVLAFSLWLTARNVRTAGCAYCA